MYEFILRNITFNVMIDPAYASGRRLHQRGCVDCHGDLVRIVRLRALGLHMSGTLLATLTDLC